MLYNLIERFSQCKIDILILLVSSLCRYSLIALSSLCCHSLIALSFLSYS